MDHITIKDLEVYANHGVMKEEQTLGQKFLVSIDMALQIGPAAQADDLTLSVHYGEVAAQTADFMKKNTFQLIETVADRLARELLVSRSCVQEVSVTVKKPWAPVGLPLDTVSVTANRSWHMAVIALGSNMGDRDAFLQLGVDTLRQPGIIVEKVSQIYTTKAWGYTDQPDFRNACVRVRTLLSPEELLRVCQDGEQAAERQRDIHWGPRTLDMDIIAYDSLMQQTEALTIPHALMQVRRFVLEPMKDVAPNWVHPWLHKTVEQLLWELPEEDGNGENRTKLCVELKAGADVQKVLQALGDVADHVWVMET